MCRDFTGDSGVLRLIPTVAGRIWLGGSTGQPASLMFLSRIVRNGNAAWGSKRSLLGSPHPFIPFLNIKDCTCLSLLCHER